MALHDLLDRLARGDGTSATARELAGHGADAVAALGAAFSSGWRGPVSPHTCLRMIAGQGVIEPLVELAGTTPAAVVAAIDALGHSRADAAVPALAAYLADPVYWVDAARALGEHGHPDARRALVEAWDARVGADVAAAIAREQADNATLQLKGWIELAVALARLDDPRGRSLMLALAGLERDGGELRYAWHVRVAAVAGLSWFPDADAVRALEQALDDDEAEVAEGAVASLISFGVPACIPLLLDRLEGDDEVADAIHQGLWELLGDEAPPEDDSASALRRWWMRASQGLDVARAFWSGEPADPDRAIDTLTDRAEGDRARSALVLWTGIDFVDAAPDAPGDDVDAERARTWWRAHRADWDVGGLYRGGQQVELAPIVAALGGGAT